MNNTFMQRCLTEISHCRYIYFPIILNTVCTSSIKLLLGVTTLSIIWTNNAVDPYFEGWQQANYPFKYIFLYSSGLKYKSCRHQIVLINQLSVLFWFHIIIYGVSKITWKDLLQLVCFIFPLLFWLLISCSRDQILLKPIEIDTPNWSIQNT